MFGTLVLRREMLSDLRDNSPSDFYTDEDRRNNGLEPLTDMQVSLLHCMMIAEDEGEEEIAGTIAGLIEKTMEDK